MGDPMRRCLALLAVPAAISAQSTAAIDELVKREMDRQRIPGVAVAVVKQGQPIVARGYGFANIEHRVPATDSTIFQSGSLGKMFTSAAVMLMVEDGKLSLSDSITKFFPDAPATWNAITVRHLLTHTSGIPDYTTDAFDYRKDYSEDELAKFAYAEKLEFPAGSRWNYSNTGYALLGFIVRRVSGKFYGDVLADRVFRPLGMVTTRVITEADIVPNRSAGYQLVRGEIKNQSWVSPVLNTTADGSLYFSIKDLIAWDKAVRTRALLKPSSWDLILSAVRLNSGKTYPYGFGWGIAERNGQPMHAHGGSWQGFRTYLTRFLGDDITIIVLSNLGPSSPNRIADSIAILMNPKLALAPRAPIEDKEPKITARLHQILDLTRDGKLTPAEFAYVRAGFFPNAAKAYENELKRLGKPTRTVVMERSELGDDKISVYEVTFGDRTFVVQLGHAPDDRVSSFAMSPKR